jgi:molybdate transport system permease protein
VEFEPLWLSARLATVTTVFLLVLGTPLAWWLAKGRGTLRAVVGAVVALPLVLPPTVLGFYLLLLLGPRGPVGGALEALGGPRLVFSFTGLVVASAVFSLPFVVQPLTSGFRALGPRPAEVAATLGAGPLDRFFRVVVPLCAPSYLSAAILAFAHTLGEFGVVLMVGGNLADTRVVSVAVFESVERLDYASAHAQSAILVATSFVVLFVVGLVERRRSARGGGA